MHGGTGHFGLGAVTDEVLRYQTFVADANPQLVGVDVKLARIGGEGQSPVTVDLYATAGGVPTGASLASATIPAASVDNFYGVVHAPLAFSGLEAGTTYAIVLGQQTPGDARYEWVGGTDVDPGLGFGKGDGAGGWTDESQLGDGWLKVYVRTP